MLMNFSMPHLESVIGIEGLFGRPGFLAAFDINNGSKQWHFNTIPDDGWEGDTKCSKPKMEYLYR